MDGVLIQDGGQNCPHKGSLGGPEAFCVTSVTRRLWGRVCHGQKKMRKTAHLMWASRMAEGEEFSTELVERQAVKTRGLGLNPRPASL